MNHCLFGREQTLSVRPEAAFHPKISALYGLASLDETPRTILVFSVLLPLSKAIFNPVKW